MAVHENRKVVAGWRAVVREKAPGSLRACWFKNARTKFVPTAMIGRRPCAVVVVCIENERLIRAFVCVCFKNTIITRVRISKSSTVVVVWSYSSHKYFLCVNAYYGKNVVTVMDIYCSIKLWLKIGSLDGIIYYVHFWSHFLSALSSSMNTKRIFNFRRERRMSSFNHTNCYVCVKKNKSSTF